MMNTFFDQGQFDIRCEWGLGGIERLAPADVIVVVDVLSFTTTVDVALSRGMTIFPYRWADDSAREYARERSAELAGRRGEDGRYTLSPASLLHAPRDLRLVLPSPNGSQLAFEARSRGAIVLAGCVRNATAVAAQAIQLGKRINIVPAGERWPDGTLRPAVEDIIGAGAIIRSLPGSRSPEAQTAVAVFDRFAEHLRCGLIDCSSGRELCDRGFVLDVELAAEIDFSSVVPALQDDKFVRAGEIGELRAGTSRRQSE